MESPIERAVIALRSRPLFDAEKSRNCTSVLEFPAEDKNVCFFLLLIICQLRAESRIIFSLRSWFWGKMDSSLTEFSAELIKRRCLTWFSQFWTKCGLVTLPPSWLMVKLELERRTPWVQEKKNPQTWVWTIFGDKKCSYINQILNN